MSLLRSLCRPTGRYLRREFHTSASRRAGGHHDKEEFIEITAHPFAYHPENPNPHWSQDGLTIPFVFTWVLTGISVWFTYNYLSDQDDIAVWAKEEMLEREAVARTAMLRAKAEAQAD